MALSRDLGGAAAVGIGIGAAFAASMGPIGYALGLVGALAGTLTARAVGARRA